MQGLRLTGFMHYQTTYKSNRKRMTFMLHMTYQTLICHLNREQVFAWWCKGTNSNLFILTTHMKVREGRRIRVEKQRNQSKVREIEMREGEIFHLWQMELREEWERMVSVCRQLRIEDGRGCIWFSVLYLQLFPLLENYQFNWKNSFNKL